MAENCIVGASSSRRIQYSTANHIQSYFLSLRRQVLVSLLDRFRGPLRVALLQRGGELTVRCVAASVLIA